jgi:hypothetical protein
MRANEGYPGEKETQTSKPLPKVKNGDATQKEDLQGGQKDKIYQMLEKQRTPRASIKQVYRKLCGFVF